MSQLQDIPNKIRERDKWKDAVAVEVEIKRITIEGSLAILIQEESTTPETQVIYHQKNGSQVPDNKIFKGLTPVTKTGIVMFQKEKKK